MGTLKEESINYQPSKVKNVTELSELDISAEVLDGEGADDEGKPYNYKYILVEKERYRVPTPVLEAIQEILKVKPDTVKVKVTSTGTGLATRYKVIQL